MFRTVSIAALAAACFCSTSAFAKDADSDAVIVTATRATGGAPRAVTGISTTTILPEDLEIRQTRQLTDVLRDVPGVAVNQSGGAGQLTQVRMRGAEANQTLVLIDGMEASDPFQGEFTFESLIADEVAKVEILRGPQSALYGSQAIGGVINYITASGADAPGVKARAEYGSFNSFDGAARFAGATGGFDYAVNAGWNQTDGTPTARGGTRDLAARTGAFSARGAYSFADNIRVKAMTRYTDTKADFNDQDFNFPSPTYGFVIDTDGYTKIKSLLGMVRGEAEFGPWSHALTLQGVDAKRDGFSFGGRSSGDKGKRVKASYDTTLKIETGALVHTLTGAIDFRRETYENTSPFATPAQAKKRDVDNLGFVGQYDLVANDRLGLGVAVRYDDNDMFDDATTYRLQASYLFPSETRVHAAGGSGVANPGFFELFGFDPGNFIGNPNLKPEKSEGWEAGAEQSFLDGAARVDVTYFDSRLEDEIFTAFVGPTFASSPQNRTAKSTRKGVEVSGQAILDGGWRIFASYTHLNAKENGNEEVRRPKDSASVNVSWEGERFGAFTSIRYNGDTKDNNFTLSGPPIVTLPAYTLVTIGGDYKLTDTINLYARVENATDENYEDVYTYRTPGRAGFIGMRAKF
jgi:vitamin B12 transporter